MEIVEKVLTLGLVLALPQISYFILGQATSHVNVLLFICIINEKYSVIPSLLMLYGIIHPHCLFLKSQNFEDGPVSQAIDSLV